MGQGAREHHWPCESCGADLRFAPGETELVCDHCGHVQAIPPEPESTRLKALGELDLNLALAHALPAEDIEELRTTTCRNCGAQVEFKGATHATECPFCASPVVLDTGSHRQIKPQALVPFVLTEDEARDAMVKWLGRLWFAPGGLVEYARKGRTLNGIYAPYWTFDAATRSSYRGQRGIYYYETRTVTVRVKGRAEQRQKVVRRTRWSPVSGWVARRFDDVLVMASSSLPRRYTDGLKPWDLDALTPYRPDYLAGFGAEGYTVQLAEGQAIARTEMAAQILRDAAADIGGDEQRVDQVNTVYSAETFKHILLPIWMAAYRYGGKSYRFVVNGQTGKVQGERPWSVWKITFAVIALAIVAGLVLYFNQQSQ